MPERHKYADVIIAWANGQTVQYKWRNNPWITVNFDPNATPLFGSTETEWRIKPPEKSLGQIAFEAWYSEAPGLTWEKQSEKLSQAYWNRMADSVKAALEKKHED